MRVSVYKKFERRGMMIALTLTVRWVWGFR